MVDERTAAASLALAGHRVAERHGQRLAEGRALDEERSTLDVRTQVVDRAVRVVPDGTRSREVHLDAAAGDRFAAIFRAHRQRDVTEGRVFAVSVADFASVERLSIISL